MTNKTPNDHLKEHLESTATADDLVDDGDQFTMNEVEKSDVDLYQQTVVLKENADKKDVSITDQPTPNDPLNEIEPSTATAKDLVFDGDQFEMNRVEKSDVDVDYPIHDKVDESK